MVNKDRKSTEYKKKSIYSDLKEFYDINPDTVYAYQDFEISGKREFDVITNKVRQLQEYDKNRLASELIGKLCKEDNGNNVRDYITLNPIINYHESFIRIFKDLIETNNKIIKAVKEKISKILDVLS